MGTEAFSAVMHNCCTATGRTSIGLSAHVPTTPLITAHAHGETGNALAILNLGAGLGAFVGPAIVTLLLGEEGTCPVAVGADISALVLGQVGGRGDRGGDGEDVLGLGVSVTGVLRRRRNGLPGYLDIPVVRHVDAVPADRHGRLRGVEGRIECVRHDDRVGPVAVGDVGERLGDVEGGGLAAPPDLPGRRLDGIGPFWVDGDLRVVADARGAGLAPPLGGVLRARLGDDRRAVGRRARGVLGS